MGIYKYASTQTSNGLDLLNNSLNNKCSSIAIGHTRWATHGPKNFANSHPHSSMHKTIILVHNGIINNYLEIKNHLISKGWIFESDTDTEVIANLIEFYLMKKNSIEKAIELTCSELNGTWALAIIYTLQPYKIFITRHGSPLLLGCNEKEIICTSKYLDLLVLYIII